MAEVTRKIPEGARVLPTDPTSLTFKHISMKEELDAAKVAEMKGGQGNAYALAFTYECVRRSVVKVNEKPVDWSDVTKGAGAEWMEAASSKVLSFAVRQYNLMHSPSQKEMDDFLSEGATEV